LQSESICIRNQLLFEFHLFEYEKFKNLDFPIE
jgi:hypothetical protein